MLWKPKTDGESSQKRESDDSEHVRWELLTGVMEEGADKQRFQPRQLSFSETPALRFHFSIIQLCWSADGERVKIPSVLYENLWAVSRCRSRSHQQNKSKRKWIKNIFYKLFFQSILKTWLFIWFLIVYFLVVFKTIWLHVEWRTLLICCAGKVGNGLGNEFEC